MKKVSLPQEPGKFPQAEIYSQFLDLNFTPVFSSYSELRGQAREWHEGMGKDLLDGLRQNFAQLKRIFQTLDKQSRDFATIRKDVALVLLPGVNRSGREQELLQRIKIENRNCDIRAFHIDDKNFNLGALPNIFSIKKIYSPNWQAGQLFLSFLDNDKIEFFIDDTTQPFRQSDERLIPIFYLWRCLTSKFRNPADFLLFYIWHNYLNCLEADGTNPRSLLPNWLNKDNALCAYIKRHFSGWLFRKSFRDYDLPDISPPQRNANAQNLVEACEDNILKLVRRGKNSEALKNALGYLKKGWVSPNILNLAANCMGQAFQFDAAARLCAFAAKLFPEWKSANFTFLRARFHLLANDRKNFLFGIALFCLGTNHGRLDLSKYRVEQRMRRLLGAFDWQKILAIAALRGRKLFQVDRGRLLWLGGLPEQGKNILLKLKNPNALGECLDHCLENGDLDCATKIMNDPVFLEKPQPDRYMNYYLATGDKKNILRLLDQHREEKLVLGKTASRFYGWHIKGNPHEAYKALASPQSLKLPFIFFPKATDSLLNNQPKVANALILSEYFLGDELLYSRYYPEIAARLNAVNCFISCDYRIKGLLERTYPGLNFLPTRKAREIDLIGDMTVFDKLPVADLARYMDNRLYAQALGMDRIITVLRSLPEIGQLRPETPTLRPDPVLLEKMKRRVTHEKKAREKKYAVGLSLRSSLNGGLRNLETLSAELLESLLSLEEILWVNCQYDGLEIHERLFLETRDNFVSFDDVDQYNDVEQTAALYAALDAMISPKTFTAAVAALCGASAIIPYPCRNFMLLEDAANVRDAFYENMEWLYAPDKSAHTSLKRLLMKRLSRVRTD